MPHLSVEVSTTCRKLVFSLYIWVLGMEPRSFNLVTDAFIHRAISTVPKVTILIRASFFF